MHTDHLGSATITTAADGSIVSEQWFGPFGRRLDAQGRDLPRNVGVPDGLRVGFTGHEQEDTLGLVDMRGRYYDPTQRRFLTTDPVIASPLSSQGFSPYAYVSNNPLSRIDPTGFWGEEVDENGFMPLDPPMDTSGMDDGPGAPPDTIAGGGDNPAYDDPGMDFDPGESMAGQDEEGGNDGTDDYSDSGSKQASGSSFWWSAGIDIDGPDAAAVTDLVDRTLSRSPSLRSMLRTRIARGSRIVLHAVPHSGFPYAATGVFRGSPGEHWIDMADFNTTPSITSSPAWSSREQFMAHEIAEALVENDLGSEIVDPVTADDAWARAHEAGLWAETLFRSENNQIGAVMDHTADTQTMTFTTEYAVGASTFHLVEAQGQNFLQLLLN